MTSAPHLPHPSLDLINLAAERLGATVVFANDEFFAPKERLLRASRPEWREGVYDEHGKWMDGWETRRRRSPGYDWCVIRLGLAGVVRGVSVNTSFFTGNYPEKCSIDGAEIPGTPTVEHVLSTDIVWREVLPKMSLRGNTEQLFDVDDVGRVTHLRFNIFPDGGVARLRVHGEVAPDPRIFRPGQEIDLAAVEHGGFVPVCSDMHYGDRNNLIMPGRSSFMGDGWETRRRRVPGHEWTIVRLARRGVLSRIELDTDHYKGNAPGGCLIETCDAPTASPDSLVDASRLWHEVVPRTPLEPHTRHKFDVAPDSSPATHVRLSIFPDGGVARLRCFGILAS
jgi:allantoicase